MMARADGPDDARTDDAVGADVSASSSEPASTTRSRERADDRVCAAVILAVDGESSNRYEMFEATEMSAEGAFLAGDLFLEVGELVTLQLVADGQDPVRAQARVVRLERGGRNGMAVAFQDLGDDARRALQKLTARPAGS